MTLAECSQMKTGTPVRVSEGRGWYRDGIFLKMTEVTSFGTITLDDLINDRVDFSKGRKEQKAVVEVINNKGKKEKWNVNPRRLTRA